MSKQIKVALYTTLLLAFQSQAGQWLPESKVAQVEARSGDSVSVVMVNTNDICPTNRVNFTVGKGSGTGGAGITQDAVNHYFSLIMAATTVNKSLAIYIEKEENICYGRIASMKAN